MIWNFKQKNRPLLHRFTASVSSAPMNELNSSGSKLSSLKRTAVFRTSKTLRELQVTKWTHTVPLFNRWVYRHSVSHFARDNDAVLPPPPPKPNCSSSVRRLKWNAFVRSNRQNSVRPTRPAFSGCSPFQSQKVRSYKNSLSRPQNKSS